MLQALNQQAKQAARRTIGRGVLAGARGAGRAALFTGKTAVNAALVAGGAAAILGGAAIGATSSLIKAFTHDIGGPPIVQRGVTAGMGLRTQYGLNQTMGKMFKMTPHGPAATSTFKNALMGMGALAVAPASIQAVRNSGRENYRYDDDPSLHRNSLGASGELVTRGSRMNR